MIRADTVGVCSIAGRALACSIISMLHVFDMDGTLLPGTSAIREMSKYLGFAAEIETLERNFAARRIETWEFARSLFRLWGPMDPDGVRSAFETSPKMMRIDEVVADIRSRGHRSAIITMSPLCFAEHFLAIGFDEVHGSLFPSARNMRVNVGSILRPTDKPVITRDMCARHSVAAERVVAYGDSLSDRHLFEVVPVSVSVNGDEYVRTIASAHYVGLDLWEAYELARDRMGAGLTRDPV